MSRRVYVYDFLDINGNYKQVESEKDLKEIGITGQNFMMYYLKTKK